MIIFWSCSFNRLKEEAVVEEENMIVEEEVVVIEEVTTFNS